MKPVAPVTAIRGRSMVVSLRVYDIEARNFTGLEHGFGAAASKLARSGLGQTARRHQHDVAENADRLLHLPADFVGQARALRRIGGSALDENRRAFVAFTVSEHDRRAIARA